jgi:hypothetical protein
MIQPDIDPAREPLVAQGILRAAKAARGVLDDVHRVLGSRAGEEALAILRRRPCGAAVRVRNPIGDACRRCAARRGRGPADYAASGLPPYLSNCASQDDPA